MAKRISLAERRAADSPRGVDVLFSAPNSASEATATESPSSEVPTPAGGADPTVPAEKAGPAPRPRVAGEAAPAKPKSNPVDAGNAQAVGKPAGGPPPGSQPVASATEKPVLAKATVYIRPDQVLAIESIQLSLRQKTGQKPDKSDLFQEAVDLLTAKYGL